jgi:SOS-response transcriptional repressor LexA
MSVSHPDHSGHNHVPVLERTAACEKPNAFCVRQVRRRSRCCTRWAPAAFALVATGERASDANINAGLDGAEVLIEDTEGGNGDKREHKGDWGGNMPLLEDDASVLDLRVPGGP